MNYGEGVRHSAPNSDSFDIVRSTIELPLDEILWRLVTTSKHGQCLFISPSRPPIHGPMDASLCKQQT